MDGSVDFNRNWNEYENGFGNKYGEYWVGLKNIHALLSSDKFELWIQFIGYDGTHAFARYGQFYVSDANERYILNVYDYFGDAYDCLTIHNGDHFHTKDRQDKSRCASIYKGGWWMHNCYHT